MPKKRKVKNNVSWVLALIIGIVLGYAGNQLDVPDFPDNHPKPVIKKEPDPILIGANEVNTCFTPPAGCGTIIAGLISKAQDSIYVQAYGFTSGEIAKALINAHNRGVKVRVLLDKSNIGSKHSKMRDIRKAGIEVSIDKVSGIAHNKVIIIDKQKVITGSFNFTRSADSRNAENVIIINDKSVANEYLQNWLKRKLKSESSR
jgi:phospholipase D